MFLAIWEEFDVRWIRLMISRLLFLIINEFEIRIFFFFVTCQLDDVELGLLGKLVILVWTFKTQVLP